MDKLTTPTFRVSFPNVFEPKVYGNGKPKFSITMLVPKSENIDNIKSAMRAAVEEKWPDANKRPKKLHNPIKDGDTDMMEDGTLRKDKYPEMAGHWVFTASSVSRPGVVDRNVQPILDAEEFYPGCYARATVHVYAYAPSKNNPQSKYGVAIGLNNIQKVKDGEAFSGRSKPQDDFSALGEDSDFANDPQAAKPAGDGMFD